MTSAADRVYDSLRTGIRDGRLPGGARLREVDIAEDAGVSRTPVREALRRLHAEGLVEFTPHRGAQVASWSDRDVEEIFDLRALLEGHGARLACARATEEQIALLRRACDAMERAVARGRLFELTRLNNRFHRLILDTAGHARLTDAIARLVEAPLVQRTFDAYGPDDLARSMDHHRRLTDAIEARDGDRAEEVMRTHITAARAVLLRTRSAAGPR